VDFIYSLMVVLIDVIKLAQLVTLIKYVTLVFLDTFSTTVQVITVFAGIVSLIVLDAQDLLNVSFVDAGTI